MAKVSLQWPFKLSKGSDSAAPDFGSVAAPANLTDAFESKMRDHQLEDVRLRALTTFFAQFTEKNEKGELVPAKDGKNKPLEVPAMALFKATYLSSMGFMEQGDRNPFTKDQYDAFIEAVSWYYEAYVRHGPNHALTKQLEVLCVEGMMRSVGQSLSTRHTMPHILPVNIAGEAGPQQERTMSKG